MNRRTFLKYVGLTSIFFHRLLGDLSAAEVPLLAVAEGKDYSGITKDAIRALGGMKRFVRTGDVVVIKPNIGWDRSPEQAANTHPLVVRTIAEECLRAGARKVKVFDRPCNDERRCYVNSGIGPALRDVKNVEVKHIENERFRKVPVNGTAIREWELYGEALAANVFINVPVAKHHGLTGLSLGIKNIMGVMGGNRGKIHGNIAPALAEVNRVLRSHLVVIDATRILTAHGPQGGDLRDVRVLNKVIASTDIVAADAYATTLFGLKPADIATTVAAYEKGLGEMNLNRVRIVKV